MCQLGDAIWQSLFERLSDFKTFEIQLFAFYCTSHGKNSGGEVAISHCGVPPI